MAKAIRFDKGALFATHFKLGSQLGDGGMGVVYGATDERTGRACALKFIRPELLKSDSAVQKFLAEAKFSEQVGAHPNIVDVLESGVDEETSLPYMVMELLEGDELRTWASQNAPLDKDVVRLLFEQLGAALDEAHKAGVVHRDLKSANLFVTTDDAGKPMLKVLDFGIAKMFADSAQTATMIGTPQYCAPEQLGKSMREMAAGKGFTIATGISPATDVFALGLVAYEVLTDSDIGDYWGASDVGELMIRTVMEPRANPSERAGLGAMNLPDGFDAWFKRCTAHNAADRFQSAGDATRLLAMLLKGEKAAFDTQMLATGPTHFGASVDAPAPGAAPKGHTATMDPAGVPQGFGASDGLTAPPQGLVFETAGGSAPRGDGEHQLVGQPFAPPPVGPRPSSQSNSGIYIMVGGLLAILLLLGGGGFLTYRLVLAAAESETSVSEDDDDGRGRARRERRPKTPATPLPPPVTHASAAVAVNADDPRWGEQNAPVTIVAFSDYQCPYCSRVEVALNALRAKYGEKKLRIVWRDFPLAFHKQAGPAHNAARAVYELGGDKAFWKFHALAFANQKDLTTTNFEVWSTTAGVSLAKFQKLASDPKIAARVEKNITDGKAYGVKGTPAFFINGKSFKGAQPQAAFETEIDNELSEATKLLATGTPKEMVYIERTRINFAAPAPTPKPSSPTKDSTTVWKVPVHKDDPYKGNRDAMVTIVEFSEFQCPFCSRVGPTLKTLMSDYGSQLRIVWKDNPLPFHKRAVPAAIVAREVYAQQGNSGFWSIHDLLFANQTKLEDSDLWGYAFTVGANVDKVKNAVAANRYKSIIDRSQQEAGDLKASGTPHFFINGRRLTGAQPVPAFKTIIDEEIIRASKVLAAGTPPSKLYEELIKSGKGAEPLERKSVGLPPADAPMKGGKLAKVVIQEFSDFQCPFCSRVNTTLAKVLATYGDKVKIVWRHKPLPFHKEAPLAHEAAVEAYVQKGDAGFWQMHDKLFANQKALSRADLEKYASQIGLDMTKFRAALNDRRHQRRVESDVSASTAAGISGTPSFAINGYFISGAQPFSKFKKIIDTALAESP